MALKKKTTLLFLLIVISASLFSTSFAGRQWRFMDNSAVDVIATNYKEISSNRQYVKQPENKATTDDADEEEEVVVVHNHERVLRVNTKDYGHYDPSPTLVKPPFKLIPN